jgi:hypothetical protein
MPKRRNIEGRRTVVASAPYAVTREPGLYAHMFIEDINAGFIRLADEGGRRVRVEGDEDGRAGVGSICSSLSDYPRPDLPDAVESAIESITRRLAWQGAAIYEICGRGKEVSLVNVVPYRLLRVPGGFVQFVPRADRRWTAGKMWAFLPASSAWVVRLPSCVGGAGAHRRLLRELTKVSRPAPDFWTRGLETGKIATEFSVSEYNRNRDAYIAWLTRRWGWNRRDTSGNHDTQFFYFFRSLRFRQAQAALRDHIVEEINELLTRLRISARVQLEGFLSPADLEELIRQTLAGSLHYAEALRRAR